MNSMNVKELEDHLWLDEPNDSREVSMHSVRSDCSWESRSSCEEVLCKEEYLHKKIEEKMFEEKSSASNCGLEEDDVTKRDNSKIDWRYLMFQNNLLMLRLE